MSSNLSTSLLIYLYIYLSILISISIYVSLSIFVCLSVSYVLASRQNTRQVRGCLGAAQDRLRSLYPKNGQYWIVGVE